MAGEDLVSQPLVSSSSQLNWVLLIELLVCGILAIFFLGYFDRLFATLVSYGIRAYTWRKFQAYIDIQALQISLLGGRIFFKEIRYHAHNETIIVHSGYITWSYWLRKVKDAEIFTESEPVKTRHASDGSARQRTPSIGREEAGGVKRQKSELPCRVNVKLEGVQAFLYNRSPVYDAIVDHFARATHPDRHNSVHDTVGLAESTSLDSSNPSAGILGSIEHRIKSHHLTEKLPMGGFPGDERVKYMAKKNVAPETSTIPAFLRLFPVRVRCKIAAAVLGNDNTRAVITAKLQSADGTFDAGHAGPLDIYKLLFKFNFDDVVIKMKPNHDFKELQLAMASNLKSEAFAHHDEKLAKKSSTSEKAQTGVFARLFNTKSSAESVRAASIGDEKKASYLHTPNPLPGQERWQGLTRYLEEDVTNEHDEWDPIEYALYSTLAEVPKMGMLFYWNIPGTIPASTKLDDQDSKDYEHDINGSRPPDYGMDLQVYGGLIHYGPWADRQRINLQNIFFPTSYADAIPANKLLPGEARVSTEFKLFLSVEEDVTLRIPFRESSKDWKWKGKAATFSGKPAQGEKGKSKGKRVPFWKSRDKGVAGPNARAFAWLDVTVKRDSTINYTADMVARANGYSGKVQADVKALEISTSVNHGLLWRSAATRLDADVSVPLGWNKPREWTFNIMNEDLELFILRDHLFLLTDLITDWTSGPLAEYFTFTPFRYLLDVTFKNFKLYLNTNSSNIIDEPADFDKNQFVILYGGNLHADVVIPLEQFRPTRTEIFFDVKARQLGLQLCLTPGNTVAAFLGSKTVATLDEVSLKGSHAAFSETSTQNTDRLTFDVHGSGLDLYLFGYVVDRLVTLKENYFGEDLHFRTLEEFQELSRGKDRASDSDAKAQQSNRSNELDVILVISTDRIRGYLPSAMYNADESIAVDCPFANADLRLNNYYMDLQVDFSPLTVAHTTTIDSKTSTCQAELFVASARLSGHRTFGLPPTEPDYLCLWDVDVGAISGECSDKFINQMSRSLICFAATLDDVENATALIAPAIIHDIQFLKLRTSVIKVWLHVAADAVLISAGPSIVDLSDWATLTFSRRVKVMVPDVTIALVDAQSGSRHRSRADDQTPVKTHALLRTSVSLSVLTRDMQFTQERQKQQEHLIESDSRTHRTPFLRVLEETAAATEPVHKRLHEDPAMTYPPIPEPLSGSLGVDYGLDSMPPSLRRMMSSESIASSRIQEHLSHRLSHRTSQQSLAASIRKGRRTRSPGRFFSAVQNFDDIERQSPNSALTSNKECAPRGLPPSSVASVSPLDQPYFPLNAVDPSMDDLPELQPVLDWQYDTSVPDINDINDITDRKFDEEISHTSIIIATDAGLTCFMRPEAVSAVVELLNLILAKSPEDMLDVLQFNVISGLLGLDKSKAGLGSSLEIGLRIPIAGIRFLNTFEHAEIGRNAGTDQYDVEITRVAACVRTTRRPGARDFHDKNNTLVHLTAASASLSIWQRPTETSAADFGFRASLHDLLCWVTMSSRNSVHVSFHRFDVSTASNQIELLVGVAHRSLLLITESIGTIAQQLESSDSRLRYLIYSLTMAGSDIQDPPFLNRTGIALRVAPHHIRNHDSWKIMSRLRHIWTSMPRNARDNLTEMCEQNTTLVPSNARDLVIKTWDEWRTWDLAHVHKSYIMRAVYGSTYENNPDSIVKEAAVTEVQIRAGSMRLTIDPGLHQTELSIHTLALSLALAPALAPSGLMLVQEAGDHPIEDTVLQANMKSMLLRINWNVVNLVEHALIFAQKDLRSLIAFQSRVSVEPQSVEPQSVEPSHDVWRNFQIVVCVGDLAAALDTDNVNIVASSQQFRTSLVGRDKSSSSDGLYLTALLHAAQSNVELHSHQRYLAHLSAESPSLFLSHDFGPKSMADIQDLRFAGTTSNVIIRSEEELLGVIEFVDMVIRHEVAMAIEKFSPFVTPKPEPAIVKLKSQSAGSLPKITIALIMDAYMFDVTVLPSLKYAMSGKLGRVLVSPAFEGLMSLNVNIDLGEHFHKLISSDDTGSHIISVLKMPPINGKVVIKRTADRLDLVVTTIIETIIFEAHAVHGLLSTLSQKEVTSTFKAISADIETLRHTIEEIIPASERQQVSLPPTQPKQKLTYHFALTMAGIEVKAGAPGKLKNSGMANILVGFNCLNLTVFNVTSENDILPLPEIHGQMKEFLVDLMITDQKGTRRSGNLSLSAAVHCTLRSSRKRRTKRNYRAQVTGITVNIYAETASAVIDVLNHLQDRLKDVDLSRERKYFQRLRRPRRKSSLQLQDSISSETDLISSGLLTSYISVSIQDIQVAWIVGNSVPALPKCQPEDLVLSIQLIDLSTKSENSSTLKIQNLQIQMVPTEQDPKKRSLNSALMPRVVFNVGYAASDMERKFAFQASGESLDVVLDSKFMLPANMLQRSIEFAMDSFRDVSSSWQMTPTASGGQRKKVFGDKRLSSLLVDADFAGAVLRLQGQGRALRASSSPYTRKDTPGTGRYGQFAGDDNAAGAKIETPGLAIKVQYKDEGSDSSLNAEVRLNASSNTLAPTVVPLILDISDCVKAIVAENERVPRRHISKPAASSSLIDEGLLTADPRELLGGTSFNLAVRICRQEFTLSCQPIARVAASAHFDDIYITANSVQSLDNEHFIAVSAQFENLQASIQHIYSRESTFNFAMERITTSVMNSKHLNGSAGFSAVLKVFPMKTQINARQLQDFLLFREIWIPPEIRASSETPAPMPDTDSQDYFVARYQQVATTTAFPWTVTLQIEAMKVEIDLGQTIGKAALSIDDWWATSKKDSSWEQNLCIGIGKIGVDCSGRTSGFIDLSGVKVRTMIAWPQHDGGQRQTPSIQASAGFSRLRVKAAFDYQAFGIADITSFDFMMYNIRPTEPTEKDRLVAMLEGGNVHVFCTATTAAQAVALFQAFEKLIQDTETAYHNSLKDIEKFLRRQSVKLPARLESPPSAPILRKKGREDVLNTPITLYTDVVVTLRSIQIGAFPSAFYDSQIFIVEASDVQARFAAMLDKQARIHTGLGMTLGQLQVALTSVQHPTGPRTLQEITVDDVVKTVAQSRGGTILRVPKVIAMMETWQTPGDVAIEYTFKSVFEGKVDVGWNVGRIGFIRGMYNTHARNLASRLGKPLPESAVKITTNATSSTTASATEQASKEPEKITAVVNVPQSKYTYLAKEPPIIETPQLRDMGEATPPLEWIGLHRDRLPHVTHQIIIVGLMGVAREVEDAYGSILGRS